ncbi:ATP-binding protein [Rubrivirga sp.]|uniref:PAS domain-containing hybrid sensor histidine kinase/response regulator n=1 Tax=Rubrivirga sp. TaxID=1885344 RepID=UPI003B524777
MSLPPRILFAAEPSAAVEALSVLRAAGPVHAQLAPSADVLRATLADGAAWDAVVFIPGGSVEEVEVAVFVPDALALFVVGEEVPLLLSETAAVALPLDALATVPGLLRDAPRPPTGLAGAEPVASPEVRCAEQALSGRPEPDAEDRGDGPAARQHRATAAFVASAAATDDPATIHCAAVGALLGASEAEWACLLLGDGEPAATAGDVPSLDGAELWATSLEAAPSAIPDTERATSDLAAHLAAHGVGAYASVPIRGAGGTLGALVWGFSAPRAIDLRAAEALAWHVGGHLDRATTLRTLRDTQAGLDAVTASAPHVLYRLRYTPAGPVYESLSPAIEALTGLTRAEIESRGGLDALVESRDVIEGDGMAEGPVEGAETYRALDRMVTTAGLRWVENSAQAWQDSAGRAVGLVGVLRDVTEQKAREDRLAAVAEGALVRHRALLDLAHLDGPDAFGGPAAAVVAATLGAAGVSLWLCEPGRPCDPLYAPPQADPSVAFDGRFEAVFDHVSQHRALAVADVVTDGRVDGLGLGPFVRAFGVRALLVAPIRRRGRVAGLVAVHWADGPHDWDAAETEFAAAVADAVALALEREDRERVVAELVDAREAAEAGRAAAERMNRLQSAFLANMSHEVRTPLTGILGFADLLADEVAPGPQSDFVRTIERNGYRLLDTFNAVLDLSRLEAGEYAADRRPVELGPEVTRVAERFREDAAARGLRFDVVVEPGVSAQVDVGALDQIVGHVVGNAVKFTHDGGVRVTLGATADEAFLRVADTGLGISEAFLPEALDAFRQEETGDARSYEGAGLGLTITRQLVRLLDGRIAIASERPGGTVVTVTLPRVGSAARPGPAAVPTTGDGLPAAVDLRPTERPAPAADPGDLLGAPFDFTFLDDVPVEAALPPTLETPLPAPTDMFDFRFGRSPASDPAPPPASAPPPVAPPRPPAPRPVAPDPTARVAAPPVAPAAAPRPAVEPAMVVRPTPPPRPTTPEAAPLEEADVVVGAGRPSVLVVEDNDDTRMLLERILRSAYDVTAVGDARSALLAMNQRRFTALVLDINLGGKETGADVLRIARSLPDYGGVFAIALTAYALPGDRERLLESGFSAYISKPFTRQSLMETLGAGVEG